MSTFLRPTPLPSPLFRHCIAPHCPAPESQPEQHRFCQRCGTPLVLQDRYVPRSRLGHGGFAAIYTVWDAQTQREQVLKVLTAEGDVPRQLFEQEARVLAQLRHPGIPRVETGSFFTVQTPQQDVHCLVMEKIHGETLEALLNTTYAQGCPETLVRTWLIQVAEILDLLHRHGILHRDIKPANLMRRDRTGQMVLIDFGGAKRLDQSNSSTRLFSSGYSPPEQVVGRKVQPTVDIYALGRTMIHLLTGCYPGDMTENAQGRLAWRTSSLAVSNELAHLLNAMIAPNPRDRPQNAQAVLDALHGRSTSFLHQFRSLSQQATQVVSPHLSRFWQSQRSSLAPALSPLQTAVLNQQQQIAPHLQHTQQSLIHITRNTLDAVGCVITQSLWSSYGAIAGTMLGWVLSESPGGRIAIERYLNSAIAQILPGLPLELSSLIWLITLAGVGTGWGLSTRSRHLTRRPAAIVGILSGLSYAIAWLGWQYFPGTIAIRFGVWLVLSVGGLMLSLGLRRSLLAHLGMTILGTSAVLTGGITAAGLWPLLATILSLNDVILTYGFCAMVAIAVSSWLGLTHHVLLPLARWLARGTE